MPRLKGIIRQNWLANQYWIRGLGSLFGGVFRDGIDVLVLPPTLAGLRDPGTALGRLEPIHLAVRPEQSALVLSSLFKAGWRPSGITLPAWSLRGYAAGARYLEWDREGQRLILTWGLEWWFRDFAETVWERAGTLSVGGWSLRCLEHTDALIYCLCQPSIENGFRQAALVLTLVASERRIDWTRVKQALTHRPATPGFSGLMAALTPFFEQWGAPPGMFLDGIGAPVSSASRPPARAWWRRLPADWRTFRRVLAGCPGLLPALVQLPGYLMGRWGVPGPGDLPSGLWRWLRRR
jgi:hypothetical protein